MLLVAKSLRVLPFFSGLLLLYRPFHDQELLSQIKSIICLLVLFGSLSHFLNLLLNKKPADKPANQKNKLPTFFSLKLVLCLLLMFISLQLLKISLHRLLLYTVIVLILVKALERKFAVAGKIGLEMTSAFLFDTLAAWLSFELLFLTPALLSGMNGILTFIFPIFLCLGMSSMLLAVSVARVLTDSDPARKNLKKSRKRKSTDYSNLKLRRLFAVLIILAPSLIGLLSLINYLAPSYQLLLFMIIPAALVINRLELKEKYCEIPAYFLRESTGLCLLFTAMILAAGYL